MYETAISKSKVICITDVVKLERWLEDNLHQNSKIIKKYVWVDQT
jgi:hypothetical protein